MFNDLGKTMKTKSEIKNMTPNQLVSWFMIASYAYYDLGDASDIMDDPTFDFLVSRLKETYDDADHYHKKYITMDHLEAGTGYDIEYPNIVKGAYKSYVREWRERALVDNKSKKTRKKAENLP